MQPQTDAELIQQIRKGDIHSFEWMFNLYAESLIKYAVTLVKNTYDAEDIVQQVFTIIWEKRNLPNENGSVKSYLYRAVYNSSLNKLKQNKVRDAYANDSMYVFNDVMQSANVLVEQKEMAAIVQQAIDALPEQCRLIFNMSRIAQLKYQQIADKLGLSIKTVEAQMGKALRHMRIHLKDYLIALIMLGAYMN